MTLKLPPLVGLYSPAAQSGKSEIAKFLSEFHGYRLVKFAGPMKSMITMLLVGAGMDAVEAMRHVDGDKKTEIIPELGISALDLHFEIGTRWGRERMGYDFWAKIAGRRIDRHLAAGNRVVIDDLRWPNEYEELAARNARLVRVDRPGVKPRTEGDGLLWDRTFDATVINDGSLQKLYDRAELALQ